ncbi:aminotransferase class V-fold PLP-dependent enzyme [Kitasatospora purpeofusca]|uniref:aminotransferase class V-fold PLP-dependent enzyme n=1 Tax=Kitasatospora purpeofusca TaxID=67352 RepID=UPI002252666D|nr:aminotransferase class V-fold PLP-dependent enzyme [Kitasatospora purpeofusca]MCX4690531.1 aminotransferase class V-fold PLP-dependent enzyme [Kitasatospora purpeofusca]
MSGRLRPDGATTGGAYLDYAGLGRLRPAAVTAMRTAVEEVLPYGSAAVGRLFGARATARRSVARLLGCTPEEVALVPNTSTGIHLVADGLDWRPGDQVVLFERDFPANVRPWLRLRRHGVEPVWVPMRDGGHRIEDVAAALGPATRLVAVSHVNFATGFRCDLDRICALAAEVGALVCVDAVQSLGALPLSVADTPVDFLAAGAHKWLCGPPGTGTFYCRADRLELLRTTPTGWFGHEGAAEVTKGPGHLRYDLPERAGAARVEGGMYDLVGMAGLAAALAELEETGIAAVAARVRALADRLRTGITQLGYDLVLPPDGAGHSGLVCFTGRRTEGTELVRRLASAGIHVSVPDGLVRVSPHFWTTDEEVAEILDELALHKS